jgi:hypothetical protein
VDFIGCRTEILDEAEIAMLEGFDEVRAEELIDEIRRNNGELWIREE